MTSSSSSAWKAPIALIVLSIVPMLAGIMRLLSLAKEAPITPENVRFFESPMPVVLHVLGASLFCILGAAQFSNDFRRRHPIWHRVSGRILVLCGLLAGLTGLWMTSYYTIDPLQQGALLFGVRLAMGSAMILSIAISLTAILRRDIPTHRAWIIRAYAIGQGAGTQVLIMLPWSLILGAPVGVTRDLLMSLAWLINIIFAEWLIRR